MFLIKKTSSSAFFVTLLPILQKSYRQTKLRNHKAAGFTHSRFAVSDFVASRVSLECDHSDPLLGLLDGTSPKQESRFRKREKHREVCELSSNKNNVSKVF